MIRDKKLSIRLTKADYDLLVKQSRQFMMPVSKYVRGLIIMGSIR